MRRFSLMLTLVSLPGWSQTAPQQSQSPIVLQVQMPPTNPWMHIVELFVQGSIGFLSALIAVWLTQRHQRRLEFDRAELAAKYKSRDNQWEFRKDVYCNTVRAIHMLIAALMKGIQYGPLLKHENAQERAGALQKLKSVEDDILRFGQEFMTNAVLAPLAMADDVATAVEAAWRDAYQPIAFTGTDLDTKLLQKEVDRMVNLLQMLTKAGRKDLWGAPEGEG